MARTAQILTVFIASPSDVSPERETVKEIIEEFNVVWAKRLGAFLELIRWETHAFPGIGEDAQDVVNIGIGDEWDIFIGVLGSRFGSKTGRAGSGTEEEFNRALERYRERIIQYQDNGLLFECRSLGEFGPGLGTSWPCFEVSRSPQS